MSGTILDQKVFEHLVQRSLPMIHEHFVQTDIQLSVASLPWFLSLYINSMPMVFAFRIVDCFMAMGPKVLFQVGLAILKINGEELLSGRITDDGAFINMIKAYFRTLGDSAHPDSRNPRHRQITNFQELLVVAFREFGVVSDETIASERRRFRQEIVQEIELFAKRSAVRNLSDLGRFTKEQAGLIYDQVVEAIYRTRHAPSGQTVPEKLDGAAVSAQDYKEMRIDLATFRYFIAEVATWARDEYVVSNGFQERIERKVPENEVVTRVFHHWDSEKRGTLSLQDIVTGLDTIMFARDDVMASIEWFFKLHSGGKDSLTKDEVLRLSESLLFSECGGRGQGRQQDDSPSFPRRSVSQREQRRPSGRRESAHQPVLWRRRGQERLASPALRPAPHLADADHVFPPHTHCFNGVIDLVHAVRRSLLARARCPPNAHDLGLPLR